MTARPGMELTSPDALDQLPAGTRVKASGNTFVYDGDRYWWPPHPRYPRSITGDELLERSAVTILSIPGGAK